MNYDIVVIGGGLGGLTAGAKLTREGKRVLLIEQHSQPGGCATTFRRHDFTFEVGLHEMDGPSSRDMKNRIFTDLEVFDNVQFIRVPEFFHFVNDRINITIPHDPSAAGAILKERFPEDATGIDEYFRHILNPKKKAAGEETPEDISVGEFLDSIINNEDLKLILLGNLGYFHDDPFSLSLAYYSIAQGSYFNGGASYIKGGSQKLSDHLAEYIRKHGGEVMLNHLVTGINEENGKLTGVMYRQKGKDNSDILKAYADEIIVNAAVPLLAEMVSGELKASLVKEIRKQRTGASLLTVYFGFKSNLRTLGHNHYSTFFFDNSIKSQTNILANNRGDFRRRSFTFVDYGQIDSAIAPEGKSVGAICCIDYTSFWDDLSQEEYKSKKEEVAKIFIKRLEKYIPGITDVIEYCEVGTPTTVRRYTLNPEGAVYGFAQTPGRILIDTSGLPANLHFASAWGKTGGGFSGAIYSGYLCAINILRKRK
ncbi:MAG TPA: NAD(P)/FAD-dependent oxidoreductase [Bacteroidales bacterium]|nr:NAD(P)/FAD-dependent oxidoreductase [Bacteroidales bacterium]